VNPGHKHSQVGQPLASILVPFGHGEAQPIAGQTVPPPPIGGGSGGVQPPDGSVQEHWHGGHSLPATQLGQAQPQPLGGGGVAVWHTPETHGSPEAQGAPNANHWHWLAVSAMQAVLSV
jgi:hypothetical protein